MAVTSDELNFLVYRYLQESGFTHSAFTFGYESFVHKSDINSNDVPPGALVSFVQKGLQYLEMEANLANEEAQGPNADADYSALTSRELLTKDLEELKITLAARKEAAADAAARAHTEARTRGGGGASGSGRNGATATAGEDRQTPAAAAAAQAAAAAAAAGPSAAQAAAPRGDGSLDIPADRVTTLQGHTNEVFICAWSPTAPLLASGSGDSTARIWDLSGLGSGGEVRAQALQHTIEKNKQSKDVTTLDWNGDGLLLATGSYDGIARIWSREGELKQILNAHKGPIFSLKWNKRGDLLLSGSVDKTAIIWDGRTGEVKQQFEFHSAPTLDVDWRNQTSFATCSTDKRIFVCKLGESAPTKCFVGHQDEVNAVKWDPAGKLLASCSDDHTAKVWSLAGDKPVQDFTLHSKEIYTIKWSPTGPGSANPNQPQMLVTASFDTTIRLWDVQSGACIYALTRHTQPVYSVAFSPNGRYLASGSFDKTLDIWNVQDGALIKTYEGQGGIFEVCWERSGNYVAACFSNKTVAVIDLDL